jgi:hypothetical protein
MSEPIKPFIVDYNKKLFTIHITVCKNGNQVSIEQHNESEVTYQQAVGAIEICKINMIQQQSELNRKSKTAPKKAK